MSRVLKTKIISFLYHDLVDELSRFTYRGDGVAKYTHSTSEFSANLDAIAKTGLIPTLISDIDFTSTGKHLLLTFDDGGKDALYIANELECRGWKGHFLITTSCIGFPGYMSSLDILELRQRGHIVGTHTHSHPDICWNLSFTQIYNEWRISCTLLKSILNEDIIVASVPGGDMNLDTQVAAAKAGIKYLFTSEPSIKPWSVNGLICLGRVCPVSGTTAKRINDLANFKGVWREMLIRQVKQTLKKSFAPVYSYYIKRASIR